MQRFWFTALTPPGRKRSENIWLCGTGVREGSVRTVSETVETQIYFFWKNEAPLEATREVNESTCNTIRTYSDFIPRLSYLL